MTDKLADRLAIKAKLREPCTITEDVTEEKLGLLLYDNGEQLFSLSPDAGKALQNLEGRYSNDKNPDDNLYVKARSGDHHTVARVGRSSVHLKEPIMSLFWLTQPAKLARLLGNEDFSMEAFYPGRSPGTQDLSLLSYRMTKRQFRLKSRMRMARYLARYFILTGKPSNRSLFRFPEDASRVIRSFHNRLIPQEN